MLLLACGKGPISISYAPRCSCYPNGKRSLSCASIHALTSPGHAAPSSVTLEPIGSVIVAHPIAHAQSIRSQMPSRGSTAICASRGSVRSTSASLYDGISHLYLLSHHALFHSGFSVLGAREPRAACLCTRNRTDGNPRRLFISDL